jgi:hypothetical protein
MAAAPAKSLGAARSPDRRRRISARYDSDLHPDRGDGAHLSSADNRRPRSPADSTNGQAHSDSYRIPARSADGPSGRGGQRDGPIGLGAISTGSPASPKSRRSRHGLHPAGEEFARDGNAAGPNAKCESASSEAEARESVPPPESTKAPTAGLVSSISTS